MPRATRPLPATLLAAALAGFCLLSTAPVARAQIDFLWDLNNKRVPLYAPIPATVRITNLTGRDFTLGPGGNAELLFLAEDSFHRKAEPSARPRPLFDQPVTVSNGVTITFIVDAGRTFRIVKADSYMLAPAIAIDGAPSLYVGKRIPLEIQPGLEIVGRDFAAPPRRRHASLRLIHREQSNYAFFRLDNPDAFLCYGVYELGSIIDFFKPQIDLDASDVFHVLFQNTPDRFIHSTFSYEGQPLATEVYIARAGSIALSRSADGQVAVTGGIRFTEDPSMPGYLSAPALPPSTPQTPYAPTSLTPPESDQSEPAPAPAKKHFWQR